MRRIGLWRNVPDCAEWYTKKNVRWYLGVFVSAQAAAEARAAVEAAALKAASEHACKIRVAECKKKLSEAQTPKKRPKRKNRYSHVLCLIIYAQRRYVKQEGRVLSCVQERSVP